MSDGQGLKDPLDWSSGDRYDQELNLTHKCSAVPHFNNKLAAHDSSWIKGTRSRSRSYMMNKHRAVTWALRLRHVALRFPVSCQGVFWQGVMIHAFLKSVRLIN
jgi:hypothetical protein